MDDFGFTDGSGGGDFLGGLRGILGDYWGYRTTANAPRTVYGPGGVPMGVGPNGQVYTLGTPAGSGVVAAVQSMLPLVIVVGGAILVYKLAKG